MRKNMFYALFFSSLLSVGCKPSCPEGSQLINFSNQMFRAQGCSTTDKIPVGEWTWWHPNGKVWRTGSYQKGKPIGAWDIWFENGSQQAEFHYTASQIAPAYTSVPDGTWLHWYPNGKMRFSVHFNQGVADGPATVWYDSGAKKYQGDFLNGQRTGTWIAWKRDGKIAGSGLYGVDGRPTGTWQKSPPKPDHESTQISFTSVTVTQISDERDKTLALGPALSPFVPYAVDQEYPLSQISGVWFDEFRIELGLSAEELK